MSNNNILSIIKQPYGIHSILQNPSIYQITEDVVITYGNYIMKKLDGRVKISFSHNHTITNYIIAFTQLFEIYLYQEKKIISQKLFDNVIKVWTFLQDNNITLTNLLIDVAGNMKAIMTLNPNLRNLNNIISLFKINTVKKDTMLSKIIQGFNKNTICFTEDDIMLVIKYNDIYNSYSNARSLEVLLPFCNNLTSKLLSYIIDRMNEYLDLISSCKTLYYSDIFSNHIIPSLYDYIHTLDCNFDKNIYDNYNLLLSKIVSTYLLREKNKQNLIEYHPRIILNNIYKFDINNLKEILKLHTCINTTHAVNSMIKKNNIIPDKQCILMACEINPDVLMVLNDYSNVTNDNLIMLLTMLLEHIKENQHGNYNYSYDYSNSFDFKSYEKVLKLLVTHKIQPTIVVIDLIIDIAIYSAGFISIIKEYIENGFTLTQDVFNHIVKRIILILTVDSLQLVRYILKKFSDLELQKEMLHFDERDKMKTILDTRLFEYICSHVHIGQDELYFIFLKNISVDTLEPIVLKNNLTLDKNCLRNACTVDKSIIIHYLIDHELIPDFECVDNICETYGNSKYVISWVEKGMIQLTVQNLKDLVRNMDQKQMKPKIMKLLIDNTF
jgi:hypothetical protein